MNTNREMIAANSIEPDATRRLHAVAPFRLIGGRAVIDANGRVVLRAVRGEILDCDAYTMHDDTAGAWTAVQGDDNAHAICAALNRADALAEALLSYVCAVRYGKQNVNPAEWETHIDWATLERRAQEALADHAGIAAPRALNRADKLADALRALLRVIAEPTYDDVEGALDRIAEHAEGARQTLEENA